MANKNGNLKSLQTKQVGIEYGSEGHGWHEPLVDPSSPIKFSFTNGKDGSTTTKSISNLSSASVSDPASK